ncbi:hypothetical protein HII13_004066 [Brettanomyces bruxellensis]|nr:hypothetical protein HII13_004066 [Brettanomyces bruxellensis]
MLVLINQAVKSDCSKRLNLKASFSSFKRSSNIGVSNFKSRVLSITSKTKRKTRDDSKYRLLDGRKLELNRGYDGVGGKNESVKDEIRRNVRDERIKMKDERLKNRDERMDKCDEIVKNGDERLKNRDERLNNSDKIVKNSDKIPNDRDERWNHADRDRNIYRRKEKSNFKGFRSADYSEKRVQNSQKGKPMLESGIIFGERRLHKKIKRFKDKYRIKREENMQEDQENLSNWMLAKKEREKSVNSMMKKDMSSCFRLRMQNRKSIDGNEFSNCNWKEIGYYSMITRVVMGFDRSRLKQFLIPSTFYDAKSKKPIYDLYTGMKSFKKLNFNDGMPPSMPALCTMMHSEKFEAKRKLSEYNIVGQMSLFEDLLLGQSVVCVDLVKFEGQIFACNSFNGDVPLRIVYTASKFRQCLTDRKHLPEHVRPRKGYHIFQSLTGVSFAGSHLKALVDYPVDVCDMDYVASGDEKRDLEDVHSTYVETMLCKVPRYKNKQVDEKQMDGKQMDGKQMDGKQMDGKQIEKKQMLDFLRINSPGFLKKLFENTFRLKLRHIPQLVIGVRNQRYKLLAVHKYTTQFLEEYLQRWGSHGEVEAIENAQYRFKILLEWIWENVVYENSVYKLSYDKKTGEIMLGKLRKQYEGYENSLGRVLIRQLVEWRTQGKFPTGLTRSNYQMRNVEKHTVSKMNARLKIKRRTRKNAEIRLEKKQRKLKHWQYHFRKQLENYRLENEGLPAIRHDFEFLPKS